MPYLSHKSKRSSLCALADPVSENRVVRLLVQTNLRFKPVVRQPLQRLVHSPIAALRENRHAVDDEHEIFRVGHGRQRVLDFSDADVEIFCVGRRAIDVEAQVQRIQMRLAKSVRPPKFRICNMKLRRGRRSELQNLGTFRRQRDGIRLERNVAELAGENSSLRRVGNILHRGLDRNIR